MKAFSKVCFRVSLLCIALVFLFSCSSRHWISPERYELNEGDTVYRLITEEADTITFAGSSVKNIDRHFLTGEEILHFNGEGAIFTEGTISGVSFDGSETEISILDVILYEIDTHNSSKTVLFTTGILTVSGFILYTIYKALTHKDPVQP